jgi:hypothetical protein
MVQDEMTENSVAEIGIGSNRKGGRLGVMEE